MYEVSSCLEIFSELESKKFFFLNIVEYIFFPAIFCRFSDNFFKYIKYEDLKEIKIFFLLTVFSSSLSLEASHFMRSSEI